MNAENENDHLEDSPRDLPAPRNDSQSYFHEDIKEGVRFNDQLQLDKQLNQDKSPDLKNEEFNQSGDLSSLNGYDKAKNVRKEEIKEEGFNQNHSMDIVVTNSATPRNEFSEIYKSDSDSSEKRNPELDIHKTLKEYNEHSSFDSTVAATEFIRYPEEEEKMEKGQDDEEIHDDQVHSSKDENSLKDSEDGSKLLAEEHQIEQNEEFKSNSNVNTQDIEHTQEMLSSSKTPSTPSEKTVGDLRGSYDTISEVSLRPENAELLESTGAPVNGFLTFFKDRKIVFANNHNLKNITGKEYDGNKSMKDAMHEINPSNDVSEDEGPMLPESDEERSAVAIVPTEKNTDTFRDTNGSLDGQYNQLSRTSDLQKSAEKNEEERTQNIPSDNLESSNTQEVRTDVEILNNDKDKEIPPDHELKQLNEVVGISTYDDTVNTEDGLDNLRENMEKNHSEFKTNDNLQINQTPRNDEILVNTGIDSLKRIIHEQEKDIQTNMELRSQSEQKADEVTTHSGIKYFEDLREQFSDTASVNSQPDSEHKIVKIDLPNLEENVVNSGPSTVPIQSTLLRESSKPHSSTLEDQKDVSSQLDKEEIATEMVDKLDNQKHLKKDLSKESSTPASTSPTTENYGPIVFPTSQTEENSIIPGADNGKIFHIIPQGLFNEDESNGKRNKPGLSADIIVYPTDHPEYESPVNNVIVRPVQENLASKRKESTLSENLSSSAAEEKKKIPSPLKPVSQDSATKTSVSSSHKPIPLGEINHKPNHMNVIPCNGNVNQTIKVTESYSSQQSSGKPYPNFANNPEENQHSVLNPIIEEEMSKFNSTVHVTQETTDKQNNNLDEKTPIEVSQEIKPVKEEEKPDSTIDSHIPVTVTHESVPSTILQGIVPDEKPLEPIHGHDPNKIVPSTDHIPQVIKPGMIPSPEEPVEIYYTVSEPPEIIHISKPEEHPVKHPDKIPPQEQVNSLSPAPLPSEVHPGLLTPNHINVIHAHEENPLHNSNQYFQPGSQGAVNSVSVSYSPDKFSGQSTSYHYTGVSQHPILKPHDHSISSNHFVKEALNPSFFSALPSQFTPYNQVSGGQNPFFTIAHPIFTSNRSPPPPWPVISQRPQTFLQTELPGINNYPHYPGSQDGTSHSWHQFGYNNAQHSFGSNLNKTRPIEILKPPTFPHAHPRPPCLHTSAQPSLLPGPNIPNHNPTKPASSFNHNFHQPSSPPEPNIPNHNPTKPASSLNHNFHQPSSLPEPSFPNHNPIKPTFSLGHNFHSLPVKCKKFAMLHRHILSHAEKCRNMVTNLRQQLTDIINHIFQFSLPHNQEIKQFKIIINRQHPINHINKMFNVHPTLYSNAELNGPTKFIRKRSVDDIVLMKDKKKLKGIWFKNNRAGKSKYHVKSKAGKKVVKRSTEENNRIFGELVEVPDWLVGNDSQRQAVDVDALRGLALSESFLEAVETLDESSLIDILAALREDYMAKSEGNSTVAASVQQLYEKLLTSLIGFKRSQDAERRRRASPMVKPKPHAAAAVLELLAETDHSDLTSQYDDYPDQNDDPDQADEDTPSFLELLSLASKHKTKRNPTR